MDSAIDVEKIGYKPSTWLDWLVVLTILKKNTLLRVIPTMTFQNSLLTPLLSEAFVTGLLPNYPNHLFHLAGHCACQSVKQDINMSVGHVK